MIFSKPPNILLPNLVLWCLTVSWSASKKIGLLFQGQGYSNGSYDQNMTASTISAELLILLLPNLVWWYIIISQNFLWRNGIVVFKVKVTVKDHIIKSWLFEISSELLILLQLDLVWWHIVIRWIVLWKDWIVLLWSRSRSRKRLRIPVNVHLDDIPSAAEPSVTKIGMVMQHHGPKCHARRLVCCLLVRVTVRAQLVRYDCFDHIYWTADLFAMTLWWMEHVISWRVLCKN